MLRDQKKLNVNKDNFSKIIQVINIIVIASFGYLQWRSSDSGGKDTQRMANSGDSVSSSLKSQQFILDKMTEQLRLTAQANVQAAKILNDDFLIRRSAFGEQYRPTLEIVLQSPTITYSASDQFILNIPTTLSNVGNRTADYILILSFVKAENISREPLSICRRGDKILTDMDINLKNVMRAVGVSTISERTQTNFQSQLTEPIENTLVDPSQELRKKMGIQSNEKIPVVYIAGCLSYKGLNNPILHHITLLRILSTDYGEASTIKSRPDGSVVIGPEHTSLDGNLGAAYVNND